MIRKSSRGNPNHDERGRFCSAGDCKIKSERTPEEYERRTLERQNAAEELIFTFGANRCHAEVVGRLPEKKKYSNGYMSIGQFEQDGKSYVVYKDRDKDGAYSYYAVERRPDGKSHYVVSKDGSYKLTKGGLQEGMIVEYTPEYCAPGEEKYVHVVKEFYTDGFGNQRVLVETLNSNLSLGSMERLDASMIQPASKEKVDEISKGYKNGLFKGMTISEVSGSNLNKKAMASLMPWEKESKYRNHKNGKLMWLADHPESKYNDQGFIRAIKRIESMSDSGVSAKRRNEAFKKACDDIGISVEEGRHFIDEDFLA